MDNKNNTIIFDMHTHSRNSHDSECLVADMAIAAEKNGISGFAVTDHCDIEFYETINISSICENSIKEAKEINDKSSLKVLHGVEIGEMFWYKNVADEILAKFDFDVVIGSVHAVKFEGYEMPYSQIDFQKLGKRLTEKYFDQYFDDMMTMLETSDIDILAHLTCPLRYINGKYKMGVDSRNYEEKIAKILAYIIKGKIALEINTSCVYEGSGYCEFMPEKWIIEKYKKMGGCLITTGSDAHIWQNSANNFDMLYDLLRKIGFKNTYYYEDRKPIKCPL